VKIFYVGVFIPSSSTYSQALIFEKMGHEVVRFNYRVQYEGGSEERDLHLIEKVVMSHPDFVLIAKGNTISGKTVSDIKKFFCPVYIWYMDPVHPGAWTPDLEDKMRAATGVFCEKLQAIEKAKQLNEYVYQAIDGYDPYVDKPVNVKQDIDVSFIGGYYGRRKAMCEAIGASKLHGFREEHAKLVSRSKINLNFCTSNTASNRIYKVFAAGGFLLTDEWLGRQFTDKKELALFDGSAEDLKRKVDYYLKHEDERKAIAAAGHLAGQKYDRFNWANMILSHIN
jgi:hypothetical protein